MSHRDDDLPLFRLLLGDDNDFILESLLGDKFDMSSICCDITFITSAVHLFTGGGGLFGWLVVDGNFLVSLLGDKSDVSPSSVGCDLDI